MNERPAFLENSVVIGAHPDDELLWFNSILNQVDEVIVVYCDFWAHPHLGEARRRVFAEFPHHNISCLAVPEAGAYGCADWSAPVLSPHGMAFGIEANRRAMTRLARRSLSVVKPSDGRGMPDESVSAAYETNYHAIYKALKARLKPGMNVFTHNPWGEYGHEEHVQLFRIVDRLRHEIGFSLWMSNYCTDRALPLAQRYFMQAPGGYIRLPTDKAYADRVAALYRKHGCWTWADDWAWFDEECFMEAPSDDSEPVAHRHLFPLNFFTIDAERQRRWLPMALTMTAASAALAVTLSETI